MQRRPARFHPINQSRFYAVRSRARLATFFGLTRKTLDELLAAERPYSDRSLTLTRNGKSKTRQIQEPRNGLRLVHKTVMQALSRIEPPDFLFCPVKRRSYVDNAARHVNAKEIRTLDISNYFISTPRRRVYWFFNSVMNCSPDVSSVLAQLLTVDGHLATGSTVSPILSFFAFFDMWHDIHNIVGAAGCTLSVYVDDLTISGDAVPERVVWAVRKEIHKRGLIYHKEKHFTGGDGEVTGAFINNGLLKLPNRQHKKSHEIRKRLLEASNPQEIAQLEAIQRGLVEQRKQIESANRKLPSSA